MPDVISLILSVPIGIACGIVSTALHLRAQTMLAQCSAERRAGRIASIRRQVAMADDMRLHRSAAVGAVGTAGEALIILTAVWLLTNLIGIGFQPRVSTGCS